MEPLLQCLLVARKDLTLQWRTRARFVSVLAFGVTTLLLFSFAAGSDSAALKENAAGYLWLALLLSSTLSLAESFRVEVQNGAMEGIRLLPTPPAAIFYGKALANLVVLASLGLVLLVPMVVLYDVTAKMGVPLLMGVVLLGAAGLVAPGTAYAALSARARSSDVLLPLLLFPLIVPALIASVRATDLVLSGDPMLQLGSWSGLLVAFNAIYWSLGGLLYGHLVED